MCTSSPDKRRNLLHAWLSEYLLLALESLEPASSDASFRRYFRAVHAQGVDVIMDAPPDKENTAAFARVAQLFDGAGIHVPAIYDANHEQGFLRLEDLGSTSFLDYLQAQPQAASMLYQAALDSLFQLQTRLQPMNSGLPVYDRALLLRELGIFAEWFVSGLLEIQFPEEISQPLYELLIDNALQQPQVVVHRDYHSRNLMWLQDANPGVIDFQDAVIGPVSYDVVSLLRDCYIAWPQQQVWEWLRRYYQRLFDAGLIAVEFSQFQRWFDLTGLQRHLKAVGIFARLKLRDGKPNYLADIPRTLTYIKDVAARYPELEAFHHYLTHSILTHSL